MHFFVDYKAAFDNPIRNRVFVWARYTCEADKTMQSYVGQFMRLRQGRNSTIRTYWYRARFQIMRPLQLRHGKYSAEGWSSSQCHYISKKFPIACIRWRGYPKSMNWRWLGLWLISVLLRLNNQLVSYWWALLITSTWDDLNGLK